MRSSVLSLAFALCRWLRASGLFRSCYRVDGNPLAERQEAAPHPQVLEQEYGYIKRYRQAYQARGVSWLASASQLALHRSRNDPSSCGFHLGKYKSINRGGLSALDGRCLSVWRSVCIHQEATDPNEYPVGQSRCC
jgi:hypothetical protein